MDATEKRQVETELLKMGLAGLREDGRPTAELVQQIARIVNDWRGQWNRHGEWIDRHRFLRDLLGECDKKDRLEMFSAIRPHLTFAVEPFAYYESLLTQRVNALTSLRAMSVEGRRPAPIEIGGRTYREASSSEATHAVVTLYCQRCWKKKRFVSDSPAGAMIAARHAGWRRIGKETCPKCVPKMAS